MEVSGAFLVTDRLETDSCAAVIQSQIFSGVGSPAHGRQMLGGELLTGGADHNQEICSVSL